MHSTTVPCAFQLNELISQAATLKQNRPTDLTNRETPVTTRVTQHQKKRFPLDSFGA